MPFQASPSPFSLQGKTILIVGADTPSGISAAKVCTEQGAQVIAQTTFTSPQTAVDGLLHCRTSSGGDTNLPHIMASCILKPVQAIQHLLSTALLRDGSAVVLEKISVPITGNPDLSLEGSLHTLACSLALNAAPRRIRVNTITAKATPTLGEQRDFAHAAVYLLSPASRWVTGSNLVITGQATL